MWTTGGVERLICPDDYRDRLAYIGGLNPYDEPNFKLAWAQTETFRSGGSWDAPGYPTFRGYRDLLVGDGTPHWMLMEWHPSSDYGSDAAWYFRNRDPETGLQDLGEYPYHGKYETVLNLISHEIKNGEFRVEAIPLSWVVVEVMVPVIIESKKISMLRRKLAFIEQQEREKQDRVQAIEDALSQSSPAFNGVPRSAAYLACNSLAHQRAMAIERYWNRVSGKIAGVSKGINQMPARPRFN